MTVIRETMCVSARSVRVAASSLSRNIGRKNCRGESAGKIRSQTEEPHDVDPNNGSDQTRQCSILWYPRQAHPTGEVDRLSGK